MGSDPKERGADMMSFVFDFEDTTNPFGLPLPFTPPPSPPSTGIDMDRNPWESGDTAEHRAEAAADGGEHQHQQRIQELEELLAEAKRQAQLHQAPAAPGIPHELMLALATLDDAALRCEFDAFADPATGAGADDEGGVRRMSKDGLAQFMRAKGLAHSDVQVERVMTRMDTNADPVMNLCQPLHALEPPSKRLGEDNVPKVGGGGKPKVLSTRLSMPIS
jgi:hypothetical protein